MCVFLNGQDISQNQKFKTFNLKENKLTYDETHFIRRYQNHKSNLSSKK